MKLKRILATLLSCYAILGYTHAQTEERPIKDSRPSKEIIPLGYSHYALGWEFTPKFDGRIRAVGTKLEGNKLVRLFKTSTQELLAEKVVDQINGNWRYRSLPPNIQVKAGETYTVAVYLDGSGGGYYYDDAGFPVETKYLQIERSVWAGTRFNPDAFPSNDIGGSYHVGLVDVVIVPDVENSFRSNPSDLPGYQRIGPGRRSAGYHFEPQEDITLLSIGGRVFTTARIKLWDADTDELLASAFLTRKKSPFVFAPIEPVTLKQGKRYTIALRNNSNSWGYVRGSQVYEPILNKINYLGATWNNSDDRPTNTIDNLLHGVPRFTFAKKKTPASESSETITADWHIKTRSATTVAGAYPNAQVWIAPPSEKIYEIKRSVRPDSLEGLLNARAPWRAAGSLSITDLNSFRINSTGGGLSDHDHIPGFAHAINRHTLRPEFASRTESLVNILLSERTPTEINYPFLVQELSSDGDDRKLFSNFLTVRKGQFEGEHFHLKPRGEALNGQPGPTSTVIVPVLQTAWPRKQILPLPRGAQVMPSNTARQQVVNNKVVMPDLLFSLENFLEVSKLNGVDGAAVLEAQIQITDSRTAETFYHPGPGSWEQLVKSTQPDDPYSTQGTSDWEVYLSDYGPLDFSGPAKVIYRIKSDTEIVLKQQEFNFYVGKPKNVKIIKVDFPSGSFSEYDPRVTTIGVKIGENDKAIVRGLIRVNNKDVNLKRPGDSDTVDNMTVRLVDINEAVDLTGRQGRGTLTFEIITK